MRQDVISGRIKKTLLSRNMTMTDLAIALNVSQSTVSLWLNNQRKISTENIKLIADALNVSEFELLIDPLELFRMNFRRYFTKFKLDESNYENLHILDEELSLCFRDIIEKYRKK